MGGGRVKLRNGVKLSMFVSLSGNKTLFNWNLSSMCI